MKDYYQILGLSEHATGQDIKRAHHQLALRLHPDRTPDPAAQTHFLEVQEAYDVLGDPHRRLAYDLIRERARELARQTLAPSPYDPAPTFYRRGARRPNQRVLLMARYAPKARRFSGLILAFCLTLVLDWALPLREYATERVEGKRVVFVSTSRSNPQIAYVITTAHTRFKLREDLGGHLHLHQPLTVWRTPLWRIVRRIQPRGQPSFRPYGGSIYGSFAFWPALLLLVSAIGLLPGGSDEFRINTATTAGILLMIVLFVLVQ